MGCPVLHQDVSLKQGHTCFALAMPTSASDACTTHAVVRGVQMPEGENRQGQGECAGRSLKMSPGTAQSRGGVFFAAGPSDVLVSVVPVS